MTKASVKMFAPEKQQIEICLLRSNLAEIEEALVAHSSAIPVLDAESEEKYHATLEAMCIARSLHAEIDRYKQENLQLTAKRMQLKQQCESITAELEKAKDTRIDLQELLKEEESTTEHEIRNYEDELRKQAERFRTGRDVYNETILTRKIDATNASISNLEKTSEELSNDNDMLNEELENTEPEVPDFLLVLVGNEEIDEELEDISEAIKELEEIKNNEKENI